MLFTRSYRPTLPKLTPQADTGGSSTPIQQDPVMRVLNLAENLDLMANPMNANKKSSLPLKQKTLQWVINKTQALLHQQIQANDAHNRARTPVVYKQEFSFEHIKDRNYSTIYSHLYNNRAGLGSAFSSIPWCYNSESAKPNNLPADNAIMPDQLYVRSVAHLHNPHHTGISRPASTIQQRDEIEELKTLSAPVLHQAIKEAVSLGLMSIEESKVLLAVINENEKRVEEPMYTSQQVCTRPENDTETSENQQQQCVSLHNVGIVDPGVGFEPVLVEWKKKNELTQTEQAQNDEDDHENNNSEVDSASEPDRKSVV